jgi:hypothetical protein
MSRESEAVAFININVHIVVYDMKVGFLRHKLNSAPRLAIQAGCLSVVGYITSWRRKAKFSQPQSQKPTADSSFIPTQISNIFIWAWWSYIV